MPQTVHLGSLGGGPSALWPCCLGGKVCVLILSTHSLPVPTLSSYQSPFSFSTSSRLIYLIVTHTCTGFDTAQHTCRGPRTTSVIASHLVRDSVSCLLLHTQASWSATESLPPPPFTSSPDINSPRLQTCTSMPGLALVLGI